MINGSVEAIDDLPARAGRQNLEPVVCAQDVVIDLNAHLVRVGDRVVVMPHKEMRLLAVLMGSAGKVVSRQKLSHEVWGSGVTPGKSLDVHITRLRRRIEADPSRPCYIRTVRGLGYIFDVAPSGSTRDATHAPSARRATSVPSTERLDVAAHLLADPLRARIVALLAAEAMCTRHLVSETRARQTTVSHHLRILRDAEWIDAEPCGRFTCYRLRPEPVRALLIELDVLADAAAHAADRTRPC